MGASFSNYQIQFGCQENVVQAITKFTTSNAYVSPPKNNWITVYDEDFEDEMNYYEMHYQCQQVSLELSAPVIALVVHDDLYLAYFLYSNGELIDEYNSDPENFMFGFEIVNKAILSKFKGDPRKILQFCMENTTVSKISHVLYLEDKTDIFRLGSYAVREFAELLGLDEERACTGFRYFQDDNVFADEPDFEDAQDFQFVAH
jgi:hypothetical protein